MLFLPHPALSNNSPGLPWGRLQVLSEGREISSSQEDPPGSLAEGQTPPHPLRLPCFVQRAQKLSRERSPALLLGWRITVNLCWQFPARALIILSCQWEQWQCKRRTVLILLPPLKAKWCQPCRSPMGEKKLFMAFL